MVFTITDKQSKEKIDLLKALGAEVIVCPTAVEPDDPRSYYSVAKKLSQEIPNSFYPNQYENPMNPEAHFATTGPEIWEDSEGKITHFVCGMGTGGTVSGVGRFLKEKNPDIKIIGVDPVGSLYYEFAKTGESRQGAHLRRRRHRRGYLSLDHGFQNPRRASRSPTANASSSRAPWSKARASLREAREAAAFQPPCVSRARCPPAVSWCAFLPDTGMRYLSKVYSDEWMRERGYPESEVPLKAEDVVSAKHRTGKVREIILVGPRPDRLPLPCAAMQEQDISQLPVFEEATSSARFRRRSDSQSRASGQGPAQDWIIREVMSKPLPQVPATRRSSRVTHLLSHESPAVFVVMGNGSMKSSPSTT